MARHVCADQNCTALYVKLSLRRCRLPLRRSRLCRCLPLRDLAPHGRGHRRALRELPVGQQRPRPEVLEARARPLELRRGPLQLRAQGMQGLRRRLPRSSNLFLFSFCSLQCFPASLLGLQRPLELRGGGGDLGRSLALCVVAAADGLLKRLQAPLELRLRLLQHNAVKGAAAVRGLVKCGWKCLEQGGIEGEGACNRQHCRNVLCGCLGPALLQRVKHICLC
mmetsp:Transcript_86728/g.253819  ORF Transcript_86728/g.253819 Transcript_86728/m.253819 type:complete len:223 (+) Transcript_86728:122-790(+)